MSSGSCNQKENESSTKMGHHNANSTTKSDYFGKIAQIRHVINSDKENHMNLLRSHPRTIHNEVVRMGACSAREDSGV